MMIRIEDCRKVGYCVKGVKDYLKVNNIDFKDFLKNGIDSNKLPNDDIIKKIIDNKDK